MKTRSKHTVCREYYFVMFVKWGLMYVRNVTSISFVSSKEKVQMILPLVRSEPAPYGDSLDKVEGLVFHSAINSLTQSTRANIKNGVSYH